MILPADDFPSVVEADPATIFGPLWAKVESSLIDAGFTPVWMPSWIRRPYGSCDNCGADFVHVSMEGTWRGRPDCWSFLVAPCCGLWMPMGERLPKIVAEARRS